MRLLLRQKLEQGEQKEGVTWNHVTDQIGMFCYTGLSLPQVRYRLVALCSMIQLLVCISCCLFMRVLCFFSGLPDQCMILEYCRTYTLPSLGFSYRYFV